MQFTKMHGLGNDFIVLEDFDVKIQEIDVLARRLCDRNFGIGGDGLVLLQPSNKALLKMRIFNADGSEAEMCGNALRCAAKYAYEREMTRETVFSLEIYGAVKTVRVAVDGEAVSAVEVDMGEPILDSSLVPVSGESRRVVNEELAVAGKVFRMTAVSIGNPHCIIFVDDIEGVPLKEWGPVIEKHPSFPRKTNVEFVQIISAGEARVRVWERGVGPTLACGSGACAVLAAGVLNDKLARKAEIHLPGGALIIEWRDDNRIYMTGPAEAVFQGELLTKECD